jgi:predicted kinase
MGFMNSPLEPYCKSTTKSASKERTLAATGARLLPDAQVCYKRYMRKWMRERMKRRKKGGEGPSQEQANAPTPLQPDFYSEPPEVFAAPVAEFQPPPQSQPEPASEAAAESAGVQTGARTSRRRRGRGGRPRPRPEITAAPAAEPEPLTPEALATPQPADETAAVAVVPAASAAPVPPARASKGTVVLAIGLPGSGKSSWFKRHNIRPLSSDLLRELLFDDAEEQRFQDLVFSNLRSMLKARLIARRPMSYVDATNLTPHDRQSWIKLAKDYGYDVQGVFFDVPLEVCMERHHRRNRVVSEDVMRRMAAKLKPPTFDEGFSKLTVVRVKQKEDV